MTLHKNVGLKAGHMVIFLHKKVIILLSLGLSSEGKFIKLIFRFDFELNMELNHF